MDIIQLVREKKIIAIVRGIDNNKIIDTCTSLCNGGVQMIEVTFNQSSDTGNQDTFDAISQITDKLGDRVCVGAGTVMNVEQVDLAVSAGAKYIISPNFDIDVVRRTNELGAASMPGVLTPTEIVDAYKAGATAVKVFPAGIFGLGYLKAIMAPISHIPMLAVGGVSVDNVSDFIRLGLVGVGVGSSLVNKDLINAGELDKLTELAAQFVKNANV